MRCLYLSRFFSASLTLGLTTFGLGGASLAAQSTAEGREILNRLERLEQANHALADEVRALRKDLAAARAGADSAPAQPAAAPLAEQVAVQSARVEEMAQSKVESSQKLPIRITGMALFNAYVNGRFNAGAENPAIASQQRGNATGGGTLRQTVLGLEYQSPHTIWGGKVAGSVYMDFFGGSASSLNHLMRLRTATVSLDWERTSILVGQEKPIISPRNPDSLAQVGVSPLTGAGNLWLWQPQIRIEHRVGFGRSSGLRAQAGVFQTRQLDDGNTYSPSASPVTPLLEHSTPAIEGRFEVWRQWGEDRRIEIAPGFHEHGSSVYSISVPSHIFSIDWLIRPVRHLELSGMFYQGQNVASLGGLPQGFTIGRYYRIVPVHSAGGWAQIRLPITARLAFDLYGGQQNDRKSDLLNGNIGKNQSYAANVMYRIATNVMVSLEGGQVRTTYVGIGNRLNPHYDLAVAYFF